MGNEVRVIMITYNGSAFIAEQLESIDYQKELDSIRIYDDCSDSMFLNQLKDLARSTRTTTLVINNESNLGVVSNVKKALSLNLDTNYIALSDQDDIWFPLKLKYLKGEIEKLESDASIPALVYHDMRVIDKGGNLLRNSFWAQHGHHLYKHNLHSILFGNFVTGCATMFNVSLAKYLSTMPEHLNSYHDHWLALAAFTFGKTKRLNEQLNDYRFHGQNQAYYSTENQTLVNRIIQTLKYFISTKTYMVNQFEIAAAFYKQYMDVMEPSKKSIFEQFLRSRNWSYLRQKFFRRKIFKPLYLKNPPTYD